MVHLCAGEAATGQVTLPLPYSLHAGSLTEAGAHHSLGRLLASQPQEPAGVHISNTSIQVYVAMPGFWPESWESKLMSSCLLSKCSSWPSHHQSPVSFLKSWSFSFLSARVCPTEMNLTPNQMCVLREEFRVTVGVPWKQISGSYSDCWADIQRLSNVGHWSPVEKQETAL